MVAILSRPQCVKTGDQQHNEPKTCLVNPRPNSGCPCIDSYIIQALMGVHWLLLYAGQTGAKYEMIKMIKR